MAFAGDLNELSVADLLQITTSRTLTGVLNLAASDDQATIVFEMGRAVQIYSSKVSHQVGELLVYRGYLSEDQLRRALVWQERRDSPAPLGTVLVRLGLVAEEEVEEVLLFQAREILYRVLAWEGGSFRFASGEPLAGALALPPMNLDHLVLEGLRLIDEWELLRRRVPPLDTRVALTAPVSELRAAVESFSEAMLIAAIGYGAHTLGEMIKIVRLSEPYFYRLLFDLIDKGAIGLGGRVGTRMLVGAGAQLVAAD